VEEMNSGTDSQRKKTKVFTIGVDGGTFDIILPLVKKGKLPNFKRMINQGVWGELESTVPPFSGPAWSSFQTGKAPSSHGIFDFLNKKPNSYETYYVNSTHIRGARFWDVLGDNGLKVGIINVMVTYPPRPVNGFLLTGGLTPPGRSFAYPESLAKEITETFGDYRIWGVGGISSTEGGEEKFINAYLANEKRRMDMAKYLMRTREWDFFMVMFEGSDPLQHELWKYIDENHPRFNSNIEEYVKQAIPNFYKEVDGFLGEILEVLPDDTTVCIMSDHGFGPMDRYFLVNNFLIETGMLKLNTNFSTSLKRVAFDRGVSLERLYRLARKLGISRAAKAFRGGAREKMLSRLTPSFRDIDWSRTRAFAVGTGGHIYLNVRGREPQGIVEMGEDYENVRNLIIENLELLTDPKTGNKAIEKVFSKDELHRGRFFDRAPDISFLPARGFGTLQREQFVSPATFIDSPSCGTHRINGITLLFGPNIESNKKIEEAKIFDLAPTILHIFGLPIPEDMDGRVLKEIFRQGSEPAKRREIYQKVDEEEKIREKIKHLRNSSRI
jgi:predicted AlkP superfamily phosphohydrolase/phosphomutase